MLSRTTLIASSVFVSCVGIGIAACGDDPTANPGASPDGGSSSSGGSSTSSSSSGSTSSSSSGSTTSSSSGSTTSSSGSSGNDAGTTDADPCRGQPIPTNSHHVPSGMCASLVSANKSGLRQIAFAPNGDILGATGSAIWLYRDADKDGFYENAEIHNWAPIPGGNNVDLDGNFAYAGGTNSVRRYAYSATSMTGGTPEDVVTQIPSGGTHPRHTVHVYDGWLYVTCGSTNNATHEGGAGAADYDTSRSLIKRFNLANFTAGNPFLWSAGEVVSAGVRNAVGFRRNETTKKIYAVVNGLDNQQYKGNDIHEDNPGEQVIEVATGKNYGYPFCFTSQRIVDGTLIAAGTQLTSGFGNTPKTDAWCQANSLVPTTFVQAHTAPLDIAFFDSSIPGGALPEKYRGGAFIALHGSWNRNSPTGFKVIWQPFNADGSSPMPTSTETATTFPSEVIFGKGNATAAQDGSWSWADDGEGEATRPSGVGVSPVDGALYVVSDTGGYIYRIGAKKN